MERPTLFISCMLLHIIYTYVVGVLQSSEVFLVNVGGLSNENMNASADDRAAHNKEKYFRKFWQPLRKRTGCIKELKAISLHYSTSSKNI